MSMNSEHVPSTDPHWQTDVIENGGDPSGHVLGSERRSEELDLHETYDTLENNYLIEVESDGFNVLLADHNGEVYLDGDASASNFLDSELGSHHEVRSMITSAERDYMPREVGSIVAEYAKGLEEDTYVVSDDI